MSYFRWFALSLLIGLPLSACGDDRPSSVDPTVSAPAAVQVAVSTKLPAATRMADGSRSMAAEVGDVAMLQRQPDGSYKRICQKPDADTRTMLEGMMRARRSAR